ncbi:hypothetical protein F975_01669 [Acinetobacter sp. ANC 3789]|uniref:hypothetical protein n=1 Tax=Acinetobacter sp. ANC 3789 TaxID=1217714 RepID=UPI0002D0346C|nr:hypothetical protein [Acinetobacter sp. ANC 3789]ENU80615.1 hypothetical protein F975_01669 [Acinetobacter sp. ANC 3789]
MHDERPAKPNLDRINRIKQWHTAAMCVFDEMFKTAQDNLAKRNYTVSNAAVRREDFRKALEWEFRLHWSIAKEIERSLADSGVIERFGSYAKRK